MKRLVNVRFPVLLVCALIAGVLVGYFFIRASISLLWIIAIVPAVAMVFIFCLLKNHYKTIACVLILTAFCLTGVINCYLRLEKFNEKQCVDGDVSTVSATVIEKGLYSNGEYIIVNNVSFDGMKVNGKVKVYLGDAYGDFCDVGYRVKFTAKIQNCDAFRYGDLSSDVQKNIKYKCNVNGSLTAKYRFSLFGAVNTAIRNALYDNIDYDAASVTYAMLTGNTDGIEDGSLTALRYGGVAHIFAVSGLHIGIIYGLLSFICRKCKLNKYLSFAICILPIFFYSGVCGFTVSSVRAVIMCTTAQVARLMHAKNDSLNSLSLAVAAILIINPFNLFNVGFQLSVCAVAGIVLLSKSIVRPFKKLPRKVTDTVGISLSAQAGTLPVMLAKFGYLSGAGILLNIVIIPIISLFFTVLFAATALSLILPFAAAYIIPYATLPLQAIVSFLVNAGFEKALFSGFGAGAFVPLYFLIVFALTDKFNLKILYRILAVGLAAAITCLYVILNIFAPFNGYKVVVSAYYNGGQSLIKSKYGNILIVTEKLYPSRTNSFLNKYYAADVDAVIILGGESCVLKYSDLDVNCDVYVYGNYIDIQPYKNTTVHYENVFTLNGIRFEFEDGYTVKAKVCGNVLQFDYNCYRGDGYTVSYNDRTFRNCVYDKGDFVATFK